MQSIGKSRACSTFQLMCYSNPQPGFTYLGGKNTFLMGKDLCFYCILKTILFGTHEFFGGTVPEFLAVAKGLVLFG